MKQYCEFMRHNSFVVLFVSKHKGNLFQIEPILLKRKLGQNMLCLKCFIMQYNMFIQVKVYRILHISKYIDLNANAVKCKIQPWCHLVLHSAIKI